MRKMIENTYQVMYTQGFEGIYHSFIKQFVHDVLISCQKFIHHTHRMTLPLQYQNEVIFFVIWFMDWIATTFFVDIAAEFND